MEEKQKTIKADNTTEQYRGIIMLRKGQYNEKEVWFGTVGNQVVSDGVYETKEEVIKNLENVTLERICKIVAGAFSRTIEISKSINKEQ